MQMLSEADAFRGRWASDPRGWVLLLVPATFFVILQESASGFSSIGLVLLSALIQHVLAGGFLVGAGMLAQRSLRRVPVTLTFGIWAASGVIRGILSGWLAFEFAGVAPEYVYRVATWTIATVIWMPLFTYLLAQLEFRRRLLGEQSALTAQIAEIHARSQQTVEERTEALVVAIRDVVAPLITEAQATLAVAAERDSELSLQPITESLQDIAQKARSVLAPASETVGNTPLAPVQWSPLIESLAFARGRPVFASLLTLAMVVALFAPESLREHGLSALLMHSSTMVIGAVVMAVGLFLARGLKRFRAGHALAIFAAAGASVQVVLLVADPHVDVPRNWAIAIGVPLALIVGATGLSSASGVALGNIKLIAAEAERSAHLRELVDQSRIQDASISHQVSELLHGPILGRLSACIMALNFYLAEPEHSRGLRRTATTEGVIAHLNLVAIDLEKLASRDN